MIVATVFFGTEGGGLWQQLDGEALKGPRTGTHGYWTGRLDRLKGTRVARKRHAKDKMP